MPAGGYGALQKKGGGTTSVALTRTAGAAARGADERDQGRLALSVGDPLTSTDQNSKCEVGRER